MADRGNYEELAEQCVREARMTEAPEQRALLLMLAQAWRRLAQRSNELRTLFGKDAAPPDHFGG
jgi:hypothetical protein